MDVVPILVGPTAVGKTALSLQLAKYIPIEIISADSRQVYRGLDLGTGKDLEEYGAIPFHLIDIINPGEEFSLFDFLEFYNSTLLDEVFFHPSPDQCDQLLHPE